MRTRGECGQWLTQSGQSSERVARDPSERGLVTLSLWLRSVWTGSKPPSVLHVLAVTVDAGLSGATSPWWWWGGGSLLLS